MEEAFALFKRSAEQDNVCAMCNLGRCYQSGFGVEANEKLAKQWFEKASRAGHASAFRLLAECIITSGRAKSELSRAAVSLQNGYEQGDDKSAESLAKLIEQHPD